MFTIRSGAKAAAFATALLLSASTTSLALINVDATVSGAAGSIAGAGGTVSGTVGATVAGTVGSAGGAAIDAAARTAGTNGISGMSGAGGLNLSGPAGSISGPSAPDVGFGSAAWRSNAGASTLPARALMQLEAQQQVVGDVLNVSGSSVTLRLGDGTSKTYTISAELAGLLRAFIGRRVHLRTADGTHISSIVGKNDVARGIVTAINGGLVTFVAPSGEIHNLTIGNNGVAQLGLRIGSSVMSQSQDFGKTVKLSALNISPRSALSDVYLGRVASLSPGSVVLAIGPSRQQFSIDRPMAALLANAGRALVAAYVPDGVHVASLLTNPSLMQLVASSRNGATLRSGAVAANVVAASRGRLTMQMPNGDLVSYLNNPAMAGLHARVPVTITPLDRFHARVKAGAQAGTLADADLCATINSSCRDSAQGQTIAVSPTSMVIRMGNGDTRTLIGNVTPVAANARVPVTITPLDGTHVRVAGGGRFANLVDARACVTINAGCHAVPATVAGTAPDGITVRLADGNLTTLQGNPASLGVLANVPVIVQPLDSTHAVIALNGRFAQLADANLCATVNASCTTGSGGTGNAAAGRARAGVLAAARNGNTAAASGCVSINGAPCASANAGSGGAAGAILSANARLSATALARSTDSSAANPGAKSGGASIQNDARSTEDVLRASDVTAQASMNQVLANAAAAVACSQDGQIAVNVSDLTSSNRLADATVRLLGGDQPVWQTGTDGSIRFLHVSSGKYRVRVSKAGYASVTSPQFDVGCAQANALQFRLVRDGKTQVGAYGTAAVSATPRVSTRSDRSAAAGSTCVSTRTSRTVVTRRAHRIYASRITRKRYLCSR